MAEIVVKFSCRGCKLSAEVTVRERELTELLADWMNNVVGPKVDALHQLASPNCTTDRCDLSMPMSNRGVGFADVPVAPSPVLGAPSLGSN